MGAGRWGSAQRTRGARAWRRTSRASRRRLSGPSRISTRRLTPRCRRLPLPLSPTLPAPPTLPPPVRLPATPSMAAPATLPPASLGASLPLHVCQRPPPTHPPTLSPGSPCQLLPAHRVSGAKSAHARSSWGSQSAFLRGWFEHCQSALPDRPCWLQREAQRAASREGADWRSTSRAGV